MHWELLVIIIPIAVMILSYLLRGNEETPRPLPRPPNAPPPSRPLTEVDRFLEEREKLRRRLELAPKPPREEPRPKPAPARSERRPAARPVRPTMPTPPRRERRPLDASPSSAPLIVEIVPIAAPLPSRDASQPTTALQAHFQALLRTPHVMQTAIMLNEVLGPPRCRRNPGGK